MDRLQIDHQKRAFTRDGANFFYLADTLWMAFSKLTLPEWEEILRLRRMQRFNVLQISALRVVHDDSRDESALPAFGPGGYGEPNEAYFDRACEMLALANQYGFTPCIHLLWVDYVPDSWGSRGGKPMTREEGARFAAYVARRFRPYAPIYSISGDTAFETERVVDFYDAAIDAVRAVDPEALLTLHLTPHADVPDRLCKKLDFYSYQSGHGVGAELSNNYLFGLQYFAKPGQKPVVNSEPPYDGHGHGNADGRFGPYDLRRAAWQSLLSGASAGITYGAHGLWGMHRTGQAFSSVPFSNMPFEWRTAVRFPGAWEMANARAIFEQYDLFGIAPFDGLDEKYDSIRMAATPDMEKIAIYAPHACDLHLKLSLEEYEIHLYEMETMHRLLPEAVTEGGRTTLLMPQVNSDLLYLMTKP